VSLLAIQESSEDCGLLKFGAECHAQMESAYYLVSCLICVAERKAVGVEECYCDCIASRALGANANCKHILALLYVLKFVTDGGPIPEWTKAVTSEEQQWGHPAATFGSLQPDRARIFAHYMRPDRRALWKAESGSRIYPEYRLPKPEAMEKLRDRIQQNPTVYTQHLLRLIQPIAVENRFLFSLNRKWICFTCVSGTHDWKDLNRRWSH